MEQASLGILFVFGMCVFVPLAVIGAIVWIVVSYARNRHAERMAAIARGAPPGTPWTPPPPLPPAPRDPTRGLGFAVAILACGLLWATGVRPFASMLIGAGLGFLFRGIMGMRARNAAPSDASALPPGDVR